MPKSYIDLAHAGLSLLPWCAKGGDGTAPRIHIRAEDHCMDHEVKLTAGRNEFRELALAALLLGLLLVSML